MRADKHTAIGKFRKGYNCCQAVACAYCGELGIREEDVFKMTEGFGSGMGGLKDTCGAAVGMFLIISLASSAGDMEHPKATKADTYGRILAAAEEFKRRNRSLYCRELKTEEGSQSLACCIKCVEDAADILDKYFRRDS